MTGFKRVFFTVLLVLVVLSAAGAGGGYIWLHEYSVEKVREIADKYSSIVKIDFKDAMINPFDESIYIDGVNLDFAMGSAISVGRVHISGIDREHRIPRYMHFKAEKVSIPVTFMNFGSSFSSLEKMGYRALGFDLGADYIYEDQNNRFILKKLELDGKDLASLNIALGLEHVKLDKPGISGFIGTRIYSGGIIFKDHSLAERVLDFLAQEESLSRKDYTSRLVERVEFLKLKARERGYSYAEDFYGTFQNVLKNPSDFSLKISPEDATPLLYIFMGRDLDEIIDLYRIQLDKGKDVAVAQQDN